MSFTIVTIFFKKCFTLKIKCVIMSMYINLILRKVHT